MIAPLVITFAAIALQSRLSAGAGNVLVELPSGIIVKGTSSSNAVESFNGIPFADPPVGQLRFRPPQRLSQDTKAIDATGVATACPQLLISPGDRGIIGRVGNTLLDSPFFASNRGEEDCLTVTVQRPANATKDSKLPVLFWLYGGGFAFGSTKSYDGTSLLLDGIQFGQPFIYVAVNYRVGAFGFMPGADILKEGSANVGLLDQRMGLEWVADNIERFGGDPDRVTLWGESAGAHSVFSQMSLFDGNATYKGKPLFRGAIMNSGAGIAANPIDSPKAQGLYDTAVKEAGCADAEDRLACLRGLDFEKLYNALTRPFPSGISFNGTATPFPPRPDGRVMTASVDDLAASGRYHAVPMIIGDQESEGRLFSMLQTSLRTDSDLASYFQDTFFPAATREQMDELVGAYKSTSSSSPLRSIPLRIIHPKFLQLSEIMGDVTFTLARRSFLETALQTNPDVPAWSYLSSYLNKLPVLGTTHATDLIQIFNGIPRTFATKTNRQYYFNFLYNLNPNNGTSGLQTWPLWKEKKALMWFKSQTETGFLMDDFRTNQFEVIKKMEKVLRL